MIEFTDEMVKKAFPARPKECNKGDFGYIGLVGGSVPYSGAIRLAAMANTAMRCGAGVCIIATPRSVCPVIMPEILEATLQPLSETDGGFIRFAEEEFRTLARRCDCIAFGMGAGLNDETVKVISWLLSEYDGTLIVDADGINAMSKLGFGEISKHKCELVITPHLKEFSRLSGLSMEEVSQDPKKSAEELARALKCTVLLKGSVTLVTDGEESYTAECGCPGMATAGSGDVLSGICAAILGNRFTTEISVPFKVCAAAMINGRAGEIACENLGEIYMNASDTARNIQKYFLKIF